LAAVVESPSAVTSAMITHKSASAANLSIKVRRYQTFEVSQTSKVYNRCGFSKLWVITAISDDFCPNFHPDGRSFIPQRATGLTFGALLRSVTKIIYRTPGVCYISADENRLVSLL
jgi:hypothetical protein